MALKKTVYLRLSKAQINYVIKNAKYTFRNLQQLIHNILAQALDFLTKDLAVWIRHKVPKRTGQLRQSLLNWLDSSVVQEGLAKIILKTDIEYAADVNAMATSQVAHEGEKGYVYYPNPFGIRGPVILWDPEAIGGFFDNLWEFTKERALINLTKAIGLYTSGTPKFQQATLQKYDKGFSVQTKLGD